jgi:hypothetical protein
MWEPRHLTRHPWPHEWIGLFFTCFSTSISFFTLVNISKFCTHNQLYDSLFFKTNCRSGRPKLQNHTSPRAQHNLKEILLTSQFLKHVFRARWMKRNGMTTRQVYASICGWRHQSLLASPAKSLPNNYSPVDNISSEILRAS